MNPILAVGALMMFSALGIAAWRLFPDWRHGTFSGPMPLAFWMLLGVGVVVSVCGGFYQDHADRGHERDRAQACVDSGGVPATVVRDFECFHAGSHP